MSAVHGRKQRFAIRVATPEDRAEWLRVRTALWPEYSDREHAADMARYTDGNENIVYVAARPGGGIAGFLEASIRPFAEGCDTRPVGYVEGWYIDPDVRRQRVGTALVHAAEAWARRHGCTEMGSDCLVENDVSRRAHLALGYEERERLIHFRKWLPADTKPAGS